MANSKNSSTEGKHAVKIINEDDFTKLLNKMKDLKTPSLNRASAAKSKNKKQHKTHSKTEWYLTCGRRVDLSAVEAHAKKESPYKVPDINDVKVIRKFREDKKLAKINDRLGGFAKHDNYRSRRMHHRSERLYVPEITKLPGKSITEDIDPEYYMIVVGRPTKDKMDIREYHNDIRNCFLTRLKIGFLRDEILQIEEQNIEEEKRLEEIKTKYKLYMDSFEIFLKEDHSSSAKLLKTAEMETSKSEEKLKVVQTLTAELGQLKAKNLILEEQWRTCKVIQEFLYRVSPLKWRRKHDWSYRKSRKTKAPEGDGFERCRGPSLTAGDELDLKNLRFKEEITTGGPPRLYFKEPQQLLDIFWELETTNLMALLHCENFAPPVREISAVLERAKAEFQIEQEMVKEEIEYMTEIIELEESKMEEYEAKTKQICYGLFKELFVNEEMLTVTAFVEDAYEDVIAPADGDIGVMKMMKGLELKHEELLLALDTSSNVIVVETIKECDVEKERVMKEAKEASRKVHQMEGLLKRLSKSLTYPKKGARKRKLLFRSEPPQELMERIIPPKVLTEEEAEHKYYFEDYCRNTDEAEMFRPLCA